MTSSTSAGVAIVSGAAGGMGLVFADHLANKGYSLVLSDLRAPETMPENSLFVGGDLRDPQVLEDIRSAADSFGQERWVVVSGAGKSREQDYLTVNAEEWDDMVGVNLDAAYQFSASLARHMVAESHPGAIVFISSIAYESGGANPAYGAAKAGLIAIAHGMAQSLGSSGITVNAIAPGIIATPMIMNSRSPEEFRVFESAVASQVPMRRLGTPDDVASAVDYLVSPGASYVTGTVLHVTGGIELLPPFGPMVARAMANASLS